MFRRGGTHRSTAFLFAQKRYNEYQKVYEGEIEGGNSEYFILEDLFSIFNVNHPEDFKGHSLSVSDVVELDGKLWYCDSYCWHKIEEEK